MKKLRPSGGYRRTVSFQLTTIIYDATYFFCEKFLHPHSRMVDQMIQAARSGRQNIAEGSRASATSSHTELRLLNVARASLEELLLDFEDYLRQRRLPKWKPDDPQARAVREVPKQYRENHPRGPSLIELTDERRWSLYAPWLEHENPAVRANAIICLIHQANYLLDHQIAALEQKFITEGGYSEQLAAARLAYREQKRKERKNPSNLSDLTDRIPACPRCGRLMVLRSPKPGTHRNPFWGCSGYPNCKMTLNIGSP